MNTVTLFFPCLFFILHFHLFFISPAYAGPGSPSGLSSKLRDLTLQSESASASTSNNNSNNETEIMINDDDSSSENTPVQTIDKKFLGTWRLEKSDNFEDFLKELGESC